MPYAEVTPAPAAPRMRVPEDGDRVLADPARPVARGDPRWSWPAVAVIAIVAGVCYGWGAGHVSIETYYAGAVRTMSTSWHALAFGGFDPTGTVTLDKLPGAFWIQALDVRAFGMSTWTLVAPQVAAGILTVVLMFVAVRRNAGARAGVVAAAVTAAMPAMAVMSRGNTADAICVLLMVVAADAALRAVLGGRMRSLVIAAVVVGLAFQVKMIEAWAILPALGLAYAIAAPGRLRARMGRLAAAGAVAVIVSLSWMTAVTLVPAHDRPNVDGSRHDSIYEQVFAYNAVDRFGTGEAYGLGAGLRYEPSAQALAYLADVRGHRAPSADTSEPGVARLVTGEVGRDAGWLLPLALAAAVWLLVARRHRPRTDMVRAGAVLWGGWLVTFTVLFSDATTLLTYYTGVLVPPIAALCAIGLRTLYRSARDRPGVAGAVITAFAIGVASLAALSWRTPVWFGLTVLAATMAGIAALALRARRASTARTSMVQASVAASLMVRAPVPASKRRAPALVIAAFAALLAVPGTATGALVADGGGSFDPPFAAGGTLAHPRPSAIIAAGYGGVVAPRTSAMFWRELDQVRRAYSPHLSSGRRLAVFTSAEASLFVLAGVPFVEPIGGYTGLVDAPSLDRLRGELSRHEIGYAVVPGPYDVRANDPRVFLIESVCEPDTLAAGTSSNAGPKFYDCLLSGPR